MTRPVYGAPDGHGRYGILDHRDGRVLCHECGRWWRHLATHLAGTHGIRAAEYRASHGLSAGTALIGEATRAALADGWERHRDLHVAALDEHRDPDRARAGMTPHGQWAPELVAGRRARAVAARVDLTAAQIDELGDVTDIRGWADRARTLMARDGMPAAAIARATGLATGTVSQRLRRYPPAWPSVEREAHPGRDP